MKKLAIRKREDFSFEVGPAGRSGCSIMVSAKNKRDALTIGKFRLVEMYGREGLRMLLKEASIMKAGKL